MKKSQVRRSLQRGSHRTMQPVTDQEPLSLLVPFGLGLLLIARMLVPAESAPEGATLWIVQLWLGLAGIWTWMRFRQSDFHFRLGAIDLAVWLLVGGHVLSAWAVLVTDGEKRAAVNVMWEWIGLGVAFFLVRQVITSRSARNHLLLAFTSTAIALAGFGIWQHSVWYPRMAARYELLRTDLDTINNLAKTTDSGLSRSQMERRRKIQAEFLDQDVPLGGQARILWEQRLQSSREPFGLFALANTFAGSESVWFIILAGSLFIGGQPRHRRFTVSVLLVLMAYCLLLTKSRTAWVGLACGLSLWGAVTWFGNGKRRRTSGESQNSPQAPKENRHLSMKRRLAWCGAAIAVMLGLIGLVAFSGGLDRFVLSEAPKSLEYRLQYWQATGNVIREHPLLGTGPGNFRQHYLKFKLPESSEEISDPHNLFLDVWANGGLIALVGLVLLIVCGVQILGVAAPVSDLPQAQQDRTPTSFSSRSPLIVGAAASFLAVFAYGYLFDGETDVRLMVLLASWCVIAPVLSTVKVTNLVILAGAVTLLVHLLGAGGIGMPAITQTLLVLFALGSGMDNTGGQTGAMLPQDDLRNSRSWLTVVGGLVTVSFLTCLFSATLPVLKNSAFLRSGDVAAVADGNLAAAKKWYLAAAQADHLSPGPYERLADLSFLQYENRPQQNSQDFDEAIERLQQAITRDPLNANLYNKLGQWHLQRFEQTRADANANTAEHSLAQAVERYPNSATLVANLALASYYSGHAAQSRQQANRALELDQINRTAGHLDKYLDSEILQTLQIISVGQRLEFPAKEAN